MEQSNISNTSRRTIDSDTGNDSQGGSSSVSKRLSNRVANAWRSSSLFRNNDEHVYEIDALNKNSSFSSSRSSIRVKRGLPGVIISFQDKIANSVRSSFASVTSDSSETSAREKGLAHSSEYVARAGTMQNDAALYIKRAELKGITSSSKLSSKPRRASVECMVAGSTNNMSKQSSQGLSEYTYRKEAMDQYGSGSMIERDYDRETRERMLSVRLDQSYMHRNDGNTQSSFRRHRTTMVSNAFCLTKRSICGLGVLLVIGIVAFTEITSEDGTILSRSIADRLGGTNINPDMEEPIALPSLAPSELPTQSPTEFMFPTYEPSTVPEYPTSTPTVEYGNPASTDSHGGTNTNPGMEEPIALPSLAPSELSTQPPTEYIFPTDEPSALEEYLTSAPSAIYNNPVPAPKFDEFQTQQPNPSPSSKPTTSLTSSQPSIAISLQPSRNPSMTPTLQPSSVPSSSTSSLPSEYPSKSLSMQPTMLPSASRVASPAPSNADAEPSSMPTQSKLPTQEPSLQPSRTLSQPPSRLPSGVPSDVPSDVPSGVPSDTPSNVPSDVTSHVPSRLPSRLPSQLPSRKPSQSPSKVPSSQPSSSSIPSVMPSQLPTKTPKKIKTRKTRRRKLGAVV